MSKPRQTTLFQSWGSKKEATSTVSSSGSNSHGGLSKTRGAAGIIDLCDEDDEEAMLAMALEASLKDAPPGLVDPGESSVGSRMVTSSNRETLSHLGAHETSSDRNIGSRNNGAINTTNQKSAWGSLFKSYGNKSKTSNTDSVAANSTKFNEGNDALGEFGNIPDMSMPMTQEELLQVPDISQIPDLPGFDKVAGRMWIFPTNYPVRDYQFNIVGEALFQNTLVVLPTGLGKTFIAAVIMYNFYRWYPQGKIVFMAPTKPLVAQQIEACYNIMGIPQEDTAEMTGAMQPAERKKAWRAKRVFFLTPQVLTNDLSRGALPATDMKCLVVDEAHKALGNHAYCQVVRELLQYSQEFRVLALSATPGSDIKAVQQVLGNLLISHIELRNEDSPDIRPYTHERRVDKVVVPMSQDLNRARDQFLRIIGVVVMRLRRQGVLYNREPKSLSKFLILKARDAFRQDPPPNLPPTQYGVVEGDFGLCMSLYHGYELLQQHGLRSLFNYMESLVNGEKGTGRTRTELMRNGDFTDLMSTLKQKFKPVRCANPNIQMSQCSQVGNPLEVGHPKMEKLRDIVLEHFRKFTDETGAVNTRIMIFSQYRDSVNEITEMLNRHRPVVKVMSFIGQSSAGKATKGFTQKEQLKVMRQFREGGYNTLVSTCVGEEGLDIGDVDLIVCFDAHKSPIRLVQRMGRTGRKREGRIVMLVTEGKEEQIYNQSQYSKRSIHKAIQNGAKSLVLYAQNPRMVPTGLVPVCHRMHITVKSKFEAVSKTRCNNVQKNKTTNAAKAAGKKKCDGFLTEEELEYWSTHFKSGEAVPELPEPRFYSHLLNKTKDRELKTPKGPLLSLSEWTPWQNRLQKTKFVDHSRQSRHLVELVEFIDVQGAVGGDEDNYGMEMRTFLDEDDIIKSNSQAKGILRYCTPNLEKDKETKKRKRPAKSDDHDGCNSKKTKRPRRSDALPGFSSEEEKDTDDELPEFGVKQVNGSDTNEAMDVNNSKKSHGVEQMSVSSEVEQQILPQDNSVKAKQTGKTRSKGKGKGKGKKSENTTSLTVKGLPDLPAFDTNIPAVNSLSDVRVNKKKKSSTGSANGSVIKTIRDDDDDDDFLELDCVPDKTKSSELENQCNNKEMDDSGDDIQSHEHRVDDMSTKLDQGIEDIPEEESDDKSNPALSQLFPVFSPPKLFITSQPDNLKLLESFEEKLPDSVFPPQNKTSKNGRVSSPPSLEDLSAAMTSLDKKGRLSPVDILDLINIWQGSSQEVALQTKSSGSTDLSPSKALGLGAGSKNGIKVSVPVMDIKIGNYCHPVANQGNDAKIKPGNEGKSIISSKVVAENIETVSMENICDRSKEEDKMVSFDLLGDDFSPELDVDDTECVEPFQTYSKLNRENGLLKPPKRDSSHNSAADESFRGAETVSTNAASKEHDQLCTPAKSLPTDLVQGMSRQERLSLMPNNTSTPMIPPAKSVISQSAAHNSFFEDSHDDLMLAAFQTPQPLSGAKLKTAPSAHETSQITFTQALAVVHQSMDASRLMEKSNSDASDKQDCSIDLLSDLEHTSVEKRDACQTHEVVDSKSEIPSMQGCSKPSLGLNNQDPESAPDLVQHCETKSCDNVRHMETEEPQFDLGFDLDDLDDDFIIPPSPPSTQPFSQLSLISSKSNSRQPSPASASMTRSMLKGAQSRSSLTMPTKEIMTDHMPNSKGDGDMGNLQDFANVFDEDFSMEISHNDSNSKEISPSILDSNNGRATKNQDEKFTDGSPYKQSSKPMQSVGVVRPLTPQDLQKMAEDAETVDVGALLDDGDWEDGTNDVSVHENSSDSDDSLIQVKQKKCRAMVLMSPETPEPSTSHKSNDKSLGSSPTFKTPLKIPTRMGRVKSKKAIFLSDCEEDEEDSPLIRKPSRRKDLGQRKVSFDSEDEDEFVDHRRPLHAKKPPTKIELSRTAKSTHSVKEATLGHRKKKPKGLGADFLEIEAEISGDEADHYSSGGDGSDQDLMEASFLNDATQMSQASQNESIDMRAVYMRSVRSPAMKPAFKLSYENRDMDVFSQIPQQDTEYMEDSFCVGDDYEESELMEEDSLYGFINDDEEDSLLKPAPKRKSATRGQARTASKLNKVRGQTKPGGRRRVVQLVDSSSDEEQDSRNVTSFPERTVERVEKDCSFIANTKKSCAKLSTSSDSDIGNNHKNHGLNSENPVHPGRHKANSKSGNICDTQQVCDKKQTTVVNLEDKLHSKINYPKNRYPAESPISQLPSLRSRCQARMNNNLLTSDSLVEKAVPATTDLDKPDFNVTLDILGDDDLGVEDLLNDDGTESVMFPNKTSVNSKKDSSDLHIGESCTGDSRGKFDGKSNKYNKFGHPDQPVFNTVRPVASLSNLGQTGTGGGTISDAVKAREERLRLSRLKQEELRRRLAEKAKQAPGGTSTAPSAVTSVYNSPPVPPANTSVISTRPSPISRHRKLNELVVLVDSREISGAQDIVSALRFKYKLHTAVRQLAASDYILSSRMAVERKSVSDFCNGSNRVKLLDRMRHMCDLHERPCLIVERDHVKGADDKPNKTHVRTKYVDTVVASLANTHIKVFYTDTQAETAEILAELAQQEDRKGMGIHMSMELTREQDQVLQFYLSMPRISYATALLLLQAFPTIKAFLHSPASVIQKHGMMTPARAQFVYSYVHHRFDAQMMSSKR